MNYEDRKRAISAAISEYLSPFSAPRAMDPDQRVEYLSRLTESLVSKMPVTDLAGLERNLEKLFGHVNDNHEGWSWPAQSEFIKAFKATIVGSTSVRAPETFNAGARYVHVMKGRMDRQEGLPESFVWSSQANSLAAMGEISRETLDLYRHYSIDQHRKVYGPDGETVLRQRYGDIIWPYLAREAAE